MATALIPSLSAFLTCTLLLLAEAEAEAAAPPSTAGCTDELISFSPCLSYVSCPPNNLTDSASPKCCKAFHSGAAVCFCYLLREPQILGFPLNTTRLLSLSSLCPPNNATFNSLCSESPSLPPLNSAATLGITSPSNTGSRNPVSSGRMLPKSGHRSPFSFPSLDGPVSGSTEAAQIWKAKSLMLPGILTFLVTLLNTVWC